MPAVSSVKRRLTTQMRKYSEAEAVNSGRTVRPAGDAGALAALTIPRRRSHEPTGCGRIPGRTAIHALLPLGNVLSLIAARILRLRRSGAELLRISTARALRELRYFTGGPTLRSPQHRASEPPSNGARKQ